MASSEENVNWKERCEAMEASLLRFKEKASKIRELFSEKVFLHVAV